MNLREYLFHKRMTVTEFAEKIGFERGYVNKVATGHLFPGKRLLRAILEEAIIDEANKVTEEDMIKEYEERQKEKKIERE